jgi:hypothetical protein
MSGEKQVWENMKADRYYVKGERDSQTKEAVLASREGNQFGPGKCYWAFVKELPDGTYYVDGEKPQ